jgi:hypothetical protein
VASSFPASYDALTNPTAGSLLTSPSHATQHINANDILEAVEQRVGLSGSSFPGSPSSGQFFHHTTRRLDYFYDGTRWLSTKLDTLPIGYSSTTIPLSGTGSITHHVTLPYSNTYELWLEDIRASFIVNGGTALSGSHKWVCDVTKIQGGTSSIIATITIDSGASDTWRESGTINAGGSSKVSGTNAMALYVTSTKTGTPGTLHIVPVLSFRLVG